MLPLEYTERTFLFADSGSTSRICAYNNAIVDILRLEEHVAQPLLSRQRIGPILLAPAAVHSSL